jgi:uncharacterized protein with FMN-binding domain
LQKTERGASKSNKKVANSLVALSSAAVLAVYAAGYVRTRPAADRLAQRVYERPLEREIPPKQAAHDASPATPTPTPSAHAEPKRATVVTPAAAASSAPVGATVPSPIREAAPTPIVTPAEVAAPASATVNPASAVAPAAQPQAEVSATAPAPTAPAPPVWKDGKYTAWGTCRHGDIQATVVIEGGRITSAEITNCQTRYACDVIDSLPPKVIQRQKNKFDIVGGATESAYAYYGAVYWALDQASK